MSLSMVSRRPCLIHLVQYVCLYILGTTPDGAPFVHAAVSVMPNSEYLAAANDFYNGQNAMNTRLLQLQVQAHNA